MRAAMKILLLTYICITINVGNSYFQKDLSEEKWFLINNTIALPTTIPASVHTTLLYHGLIKDPYVGFRDVEYSWIADQDWLYQTTFRIKEKLFGSLFVRLRLFGLDTIATVLFNGKLVGKVDNMFAEWTFPLKRVEVDDNVLSIFFKSPTQYALNQSLIYTKFYGYDVPPLSAPDVQHGRDHPNFIRKEQCSFSWDWGPSFPTIGVWRPVVLEFSESLFIDEFKIYPYYRSDMQHWELKFEVIIDCKIPQDPLLINHGFLNTLVKGELSCITGINIIELRPIIVPEAEIERWWPNGYGTQKLYNAFVEIKDLDNSSIYKDTQFGFRTVELIQEPISGSEGMSFYFKINSHPIFLKGANWIPADSFQERVTSDVLEDLLNSTIDANINCLRVWGGGVYEQDRFYQLADQKGILIWQDLMFAVALYPVNQEFLQTVEKEIKYQIRRLHNHPSVIAWSGNNENEAAIAQKWWPEVKTNREQLVADYGKLYGDTIQPIILQEDGTRPYLMSSPSNGNENKETGYISNNPQNSSYGDVHFYDYKNNCWDPKTFPNPRFASEYGYQSYPSFVAMSNVTPSDDLLKWNSSLMYHRQHHGNGNMEIERFIEQHYALPLVKSEKDYLRYMMYMSQIVQATCTKYESEHYRRLQDNLIKGEGHTMGALYWQLNDIWQAPSWASIEYGGRWKMLHYYVKSFFAPTSVSAYVQDGVVHAHVVQDHITEEEMSLQVTVYTWDSFSPVWNQVILVKPSIKHSMEVYQQKFEYSMPYFIVFQLFDQLSGKFLSQTELFTSNFTSNLLQNPNLKISKLHEVSENEIEFTIQADQPAAFVWFETSMKGTFSKNGFLMYEPQDTIMFYGRSSVKADDLLKSLRTISLHDAYGS